MENNTYKKLERIVRGFSNYRRIQILELLAKKPDLSIFNISEELDVNFKTISAHASRLLNAGALSKKEDFTSVRHKLTPRGKAILMFLRTLE